MKVNNKNKLLFFTFATITSLSIPTTPSAAAATVKAAYWYQDSGFALDNINATLFTHLFCSHATLDPSTNHLIVSDDNSASFSRFTSTLQRTNPTLQTLLSIGGPDAPFTSMASSAPSRKSFIDSSIATARSYSFLGLDLDYEYPSTQSEMSNLGILLTEWRAAINAESNSTHRPPLLLTAAVAFRSDHYSVPYPASTMAKALDWLNLMAYDFWGPTWSNVTRPASALYDPVTGGSSSLGVASWINDGVPASKLLLGVPFYGYGYTLADATENGYLAPATGPAFSSDGQVTFQGIRAFKARNTGVTTVYNSTTVESYSYVGTTWITYDDVEAVAKKMSFVRQKGMLGYFAWHVGADDDFLLATTAYNSL